MLQLLARKVGETFDGVITGVTNFGIFVQLRRFLVEGLIRLEELGDDWWDVNARYGTIRGERTGKTYRIGDVMSVQIVGVDLAGRKLSLAPKREKKKHDAERQASSSPGKKGTKRSQGGTKPGTDKRGKGGKARETGKGEESGKARETGKRGKSGKTAKRSKSAKSVKNTESRKGARGKRKKR